MQYIDLLNIKTSMSTMVLSNLPYDKKLKCYGLLDYATTVFTNLNKHRAAEYGIPCDPNGSLNATKFYKETLESFKAQLEKSGDFTISEDQTKEQAILKEAERLATEKVTSIWTKFNEEDYIDLIEPVKPNLLNFLDEKEFGMITRPRVITRQAVDGSMDKIDWFLTGEQESLLYKFLVKPAESEPKKKGK